MAPPFESSHPDYIEQTAEHFVLLSFYCYCVACKPATKPQKICCGTKPQQIIYKRYTNSALLLVIEEILGTLASDSCE